MGESSNSQGGELASALSQGSEPLRSYRKRGWAVAQVRMSSALVLNYNSVVNMSRYLWKSNFALQP